MPQMLSLPQILILFQSLAFTPVHYSSLFTLQAIGGPMIRKAEVRCQGVPLEGDAFPTGVRSSVAQSCPTLCDSMDCSPQGSSVHGILQAVILGCHYTGEWVAIPLSRRSSQPRDQTRGSCTSCPGRWFLDCRATWEVLQATLSFAL